ncbi:hypothetical protein F5Y05DRAFT_424884 [Hypoxylon sp. FL0543]|nr:hypothetical protein F5Y05DRAFT_424884 [Hypoxylon sp. FL0543]
MQRIIDAWNRKTYLQTYWDPRTGSQPQGRRVGSISTDEQFYMLPEPGSGESILVGVDVTDFPQVRSSEGNNYTRLDEDRRTDLSFEDNIYINDWDDPTSNVGLISGTELDYEGDSDSTAKLPLLTTIPEGNSEEENPPQEYPLQENPLQDNHLEENHSQENPLQENPLRENPLQEDLLRENPSQENLPQEKNPKVPAHSAYPLSETEADEVTQRWCMRKFLKKLATKVVHRKSEGARK